MDHPFKFLPKEEIYLSTSPVVSCFFWKSEKSKFESKDSVIESYRIKGKHSTNDFLRPNLPLRKVHGDSSNARGAWNLLTANLLESDLPRGWRLKRTG